MKNKFWLISAILVLGLIIIGFFAFRPGHDSGKNDTRPVVKIGAVLPLSGDIAYIGRSARVAMEMQLAREQEKGLKYNYKLIFENSGDSAARSASAAKKLIHADKVDATVTIWNTTGIVVANVANPEQILNFMCSWEEEGLRGPYSYNMIATHADLTAAMARELKDRNIKSVVLLSNDEGNTLTDILATRLKSSGIKVLAHEKTVYGQRDYLNEVMRFKPLAPDMYIVIGDPGLVYMFTRRLYEATGKKNVTTIDGFTDVEEDIRPMFNNLWYIDSNNMGTAEFKKELLAAKGVQSQSCAGNSAANLQIIINAFENAKVADGDIRPTREAVNEYIKNNDKNFETSAAGYVTLGEHGMLGTRPLVLIIKDGKIEILKQ